MSYSQTWALIGCIVCAIALFVILPVQLAERLHRPPEKGRVAWETVDPETPGIAFLERTRVPGGWIVRMRTGICYVPDPNHEWLADQPQTQSKP